MCINLYLKQLTLNSIKHTNVGCRCGLMDRNMFTLFKNQMTWNTYPGMMAQTYTPSTEEAKALSLRTAVW